MAKKGSTEISLKERIEIEKLFKKGWSSYKIAKEIGRSLCCVKHEFRRFPGAPYDAQTAHTDAVLKRRNKFLSFKKKRSFIKKLTLTSRVENLEMQLEILHDTIKELLNDKKNKRL